MEYKDLEKLTLSAFKADKGNDVALTFSENGKTESFTSAEVSEALANEFRRLTGYTEEHGCDYRTYKQNENMVFALIEKAISEVLPPRVMAQYSQFADVQRVAQGDKAVFKLKVTEASKRRARTFVTRVGLAGRYETFMLDGAQVEVNTGAFGSAAKIGFEEFLDGRWQFSDFTTIILEQLDYIIYEEIAKALEALVESIPASNKTVQGGFDEEAMDDLLSVIDTYGRASIFCTQEFANKMIPAEARMSNSMKDALWEKGWLGNYKGHNVIILDQSFTDETNMTKVIDPSLAYIIPTGAEKPVKVVFEGQTHVRNIENNDDWSSDMQVYMKVGVATVATLGTLNWIGSYKNTALKKTRD